MNAAATRWVLRPYFRLRMIQRTIAYLRTAEGRDQLITYLAEGLSMLGMVAAYALAANAGKQQLDLYVVARRTVSFVYPLLLIGAAVGLTRFVAMSADPLRQRAYLRGALSWVFPLGILLFIVGWLAAGPLAWMVFGVGAGVDLVAPLGAMIAGVSLHGVAYSYLRGKRNMVLANIIQVFALAAAPCIALIVFDELKWVLWSTGIAWTVVAVAVLLPHLLRPALQSNKRERSELLRYGLPRLPGDMAMGALLTVPVYVVARTHGLSASGELGFGTTLLNFAAAIFSPVALLLLPASAAQLAAGDHSGLSARIGRMVRLMLLACVALTLAFEIGADLLLKLYLKETGEAYVTTSRVIFLGALPFGFFIGLRSVLDAYFHTPRNGINLIVSFVIFMLGALVHFIVPSPPMVVCVSLVVALYYLGYATWRDVRFVRSELERRAVATDKDLRIAVVIPAREDEVTAYPFARRQAEAFSRVHGATVKVFHLRSRTSLWKLWRDRGRFKRMLRAERPDVVHCHYGSVSALFTVVSSSVPVVVSFHGSDLNRTPQDGFLRDLLGRVFSQFAAFFSAGIVCVSEPLRRKLWWRQEEAMVLPVGVDATHFAPMDRAECRARLGWTGEERVVLFNANNPGVKRLDIAEATIAGLRARGLKVRLEKLNSNIDPERMPVLMNASDALLLCSDKEGSPTMVKEAMACGLPVVSCDVGDVRERLNGVMPGAVVAQDTTLLADALKDVLASGARSNGRDLLERNGVDARTLDEATFAYLRSILIRA